MVLPCIVTMRTNTNLFKLAYLGTGAHELRHVIYSGNFLFTKILFWHVTAIFLKDIVVVDLKKKQQTKKKQTNKNKNKKKKKKKLNKTI